MKIPTPLDPTQFSVGNSDQLVRINRIKQGFAKTQIKEIINAGSPNDPIPTNTKKKRSNKQPPKVSKPSVETFVPVNSENLSSIDKMFDSDATYAETEDYGTPLLHGEKQLPSVEEQFTKRISLLKGQSPVEALKKARGSKVNKSEDNEFNLPEETHNSTSLLKSFELIELIEKISTKTVQNILKEYIESQKNKRTYEIYDKDKGIIKIGSKLYKLSNYLPK